MTAWPRRCSGQRGDPHSPRLTAGDAWAFPTRVSRCSRPGRVLIIHWWAITGSTLLQLVRLAAKSGASWIAAVCMLNQMDVNDAEALRMLRAVSGRLRLMSTAPGRFAIPRVHERLVPVAIRFVAVSSITALDAHDCPICATRERYQLATSPRRPEAAPRTQICCGHAEAAGAGRGFP